MRRSLALTLAFILCVAAGSAHAQRAQRQVQPGAAREARPDEAPALSFRPRSSDERLRAVQRLLVEQRRGVVAHAAVAGQALGDTFSLTARAPYAEGRGSLLASNVDYYNSSAPPSGNVLLSASGGEVMLHIIADPTRRVLVECTVLSDAPFNGRFFTYTNGEIWSGSSTPHETVVSFLSPPLASLPHQHLYFRLVSGGVGYWRLAGCEVTRVAIP